MVRLKTIDWVENSCVIIDQTKLPESLEYLKISSVQEMYDAIFQLKVRGAPAIGIAGAFGCYIAIEDLSTNATIDELLAALHKNAEYLSGCRPTAVNLKWAIERVCSSAESKAKEVNSCNDLKAFILECAQAILEEDREMGRAIGEHGAELLSSADTLLTHCNAGGLATAEYGTALAPVYIAAEKGKLFTVYADETRPLLQGSRITAFELQKAGIPVTVICDNMAASVMAQGKIDAVIVGADRITANGDTANKIGTYGVALLAKAHSLPFYVAAPSSTFDLSLPDGNMIPIEERSCEEVACGFGKRTSPVGVQVYNPAFDVTPSSLVTAFITEKGILRPPYQQSIPSIL